MLIVLTVLIVLPNKYLGKWLLSNEAIEDSERVVAVVIRMCESLSGSIRSSYCSERYSRIASLPKKYLPTRT